MPLTDTHCHLQDSRYGDSLPEVLDRARGAGVTRFVCCCASEKRWDDVLSLAIRENGVIPMLGQHPWYLDHATQGWERRLFKLLQTTAAGVGECGLDFAIPDANRARQMAVLMPQWQMALELNRPMSLHCRKAFDAMFGLANELGLPSKGAVIHAFSGSAEQAMVAIRHGFYISFCCSLMNPKNKRIRKALLSVPLERLLLETDSPDISPVKDQLNEPSNLAHLFKAVTELLETTPEKLEKQLQDNTGRVFGTLLNFVS